MDDQLQLPPPSTPVVEPKFTGFPRVGNNSSGYDFASIREDYLSCSSRTWREFCERRDYNPDAKGIPHKKWTREKKYRSAFIPIIEQIEEEGTRLGPNLLLAQVRAVRRVPEAAAAMLSLLQHAIQIHLEEVRHDSVLLKQARERKIPVSRGTLTFSLDASNAAMLANALKNTTEILHKSLGIDTTTGMTPERWLHSVEEELAKVDGTNDIVTQGTTSPVQVEILGAKSLRDAMKEAYEQWMDKPGEVQRLDAAPPPVGDDATDV